MWPYYVYGYSLESHSYLPTNQTQRSLYLSLFPPLEFLLAASLVWLFCFVLFGCSFLGIAIFFSVMCTCAHVNRFIWGLHPPPSPSIYYGNI